MKQQDSCRLMADHGEGLLTPNMPSLLIPHGLVEGEVRLKLSGQLCKGQCEWEALRGHLMSRGRKPQRGHFLSQLRQKVKRGESSGLGHPSSDLQL